MKRAFTLAEVLITLGIIGVVASMTIPTLINKYQKQVTAVKLKKAWNILSNAYVRAEQEFDSSEYWVFPQSGTISDVEFFNKYFKPFLKTSDVKIRLYSASNLSGGDAYIAQILSPLGTDAISSIDGMCLYPWSNHQFFMFTVDINCMAPPNVAGKDIFDVAELVWMGDHKMVVPWIAQINSPESRRNFIETCKTRSFGNGHPGACFSVFVYDGWEFKDDYPWK